MLGKGKKTEKDYYCEKNKTEGGSGERGYAQLRRERVLRGSVASTRTLKKPIQAEGNGPKITTGVRGTNWNGNRLIALYHRKNIGRRKKSRRKQGRKRQERKTT